MIQKSALTGLTKAEALNRFNEARKRPGAVVEMIEQADGLWTVTIVWDDAADVSFQDLEAFDETAANLHVDMAAHLASSAPEAGEKLGQLSSKFESNGRPGAIGFDTKGGFSYGAYQIATRTGTMNKFMSFLQSEFPAFATKLNGAGGVNAALAGQESFKTAWTALAADPAFFDAQHAFIGSTHYEPFAKRLQTKLGIDVAARSAVLRDVVWSVAVQHGPANTVFDAALLNKDVSALTDKKMIPLVYAERSNVDKYFPSSNAQVKTALVARFQQELALAMARLG